MKKFLPISFFFFGIFSSYSQTLDVISDGAIISVYSDQVIIDGNFFHQGNDTIENSGNIYLTGNWTNNNPSNNVFSNGPDGWLHLSGASQTIGGTTQTHFNNIELSGTGIKYLLNVNGEVEDTLALNNRVFDVGDSTILVLNNGTITNTGNDLGGYVTSSNDGGLSRATDSGNSYSFPVGSNVGIPRYRPVDLTPNASSANTFKVRMANVKPDNDSYNIASKDSSLCEVDSNFYHRIYHSFGGDAADLTIYYDETADGSFQTLAHWEGTPVPFEWKNTSGSSTTGFPFSTVTKTGWSDFSTKPFALAKAAPSLPVITASGPTTFCEGGSVNLSASPADSFLWSNGLTTQNITVTSSGSYSVTVTNANGCSASSAIVQVVVNNFTPPSINTSGLSTTICEGFTDTLDAGTGYSNYSWSTGESTQTIIVDSAGNYSVTVSDSNGCNGADTIIISVSSFPDSLILASGPTSFCEGSFVGLDAGSGYSSYLWSTGETTQVINVDSSGNYSVLVTDTNNCKNDSAATLISVTVNANPTIVTSPDDTINLGLSDTLVAVGAVSYQWQPGNGSGNTFIVSPTEETTYTVIGTDANGCSDTATVKISVDAKCVFWLPNIFSPNGDGENDELKVYGRGLEWIALTVYDRWGNRVFESADVNSSWNGQFNGNLLNTGVYVYILKGKCISTGEEFEQHGNVTLTR